MHLALNNIQWLIGLQNPNKQKSNKKQIYMLSYRVCFCLCVCRCMQVCSCGLTLDACVCVCVWESLILPF